MAIQTFFIHDDVYLNSKTKNTISVKVSLTVKLKSPK